MPNRPPSRPALPVAALVLLTVALAPRPAAAVDDFWAFWGDGRAELDGYALVEPRYGAPRAGQAVLVFVTEDWSESLGVKADPGKHPPADVFPVLKLNFVRGFQTGIYDYHVLASTFARVDGAFTPVKLSFASQEWCGNVYQQWRVRGGQMGEVSHSYFDGEADRTRDEALPPGALFEEALPIALRGLRGDFLPPGGARTVPLFSSAIRARFEHQEQAFREATIRRSPQSTKVTTTLGTLPAFTYTVEEKGGPTTTYTLEAAYPHRILAWSTSTGESGRILGSARLPYWKLNAPGGESYLKQLGLAPVVPPR